MRCHPSCLGSKRQLHSSTAALTHEHRKMVWQKKTKVEKYVTHGKDFHIEEIIDDIVEY